jgi:hypothetical protein
LKVDSELARNAIFIGHVPLLIDFRIGVGFFQFQ